MAAVLKLKREHHPKPPLKKMSGNGHKPEATKKWEATFGALKLDQQSRGLRELSREAVDENTEYHTRLRWHMPFLERIERTEGSDTVVVFNDSTLTRRMLEMAKSRLQKRYQIRTQSNPYTSTVAVWVQRRVHR
jgi:hypothetical protein